MEQLQGFRTWALLHCYSTKISDMGAAPFYLNTYRVRETSCRMFLWYSSSFFCLQEDVSLIIMYILFPVVCDPSKKMKQSQSLSDSKTADGENHLDISLEEEEVSDMSPKKSLELGDGRKFDDPPPPKYIAGHIGIHNCYCQSCSEKYPGLLLCEPLRSTSTCCELIISLVLMYVTSYWNWCIATVLPFSTIELGGVISYHT